jgi:type II secretory pathway pseudopilin PulG
VIPGHVTNNCDARGNSTVVPPLRRPDVRFSGPSAERRHYGRRGGASLIELLVVISIITALFSMVGVVFHRIFLADQVAMRAALTERTVSRLADQFRRDVHAAITAKRAEAENGAGVRLELTPRLDAATEPSASATVNYSIRAGEVLRELIVDGKVTSREVYRLPECQIHLPVATNEAKVEMVGLTIERQGSTITPQPQATRPRRTLAIEAALGRDDRLATAFATKSPAPLKEESK